MTQTRIWRFLPLALLALSAAPAWPQVPPVPAAPAAPPGLEQADAQRTKWELDILLRGYPPSLRNVLSLDPTLLTNQNYLAPYPGLATFLSAHPEVIHNPQFFLGESFDRERSRQDYVLGTWRDAIQGLEFLMGFALAIGLITWLLRGVMDYRRWNRLNKVQTEIHSRLLERLTNNEELLAYIQSPAGSKFLESSPITLDPGERSPGAPLGRILWTVQVGVVIAATGAGLLVIAARGIGE
ncbi:MAG TPA: hypothetical protein VK789_19830, partial [Bryobacteraceae bacterium]|nr:hypothetical protein [Bryobacteraceae bacterium]